MERLLSTDTRTFWFAPVRLDDTDEELEEREEREEEDELAEDVWTGG